MSEEKNVRRGITISESLPSLGFGRGEVWQASRLQLWNANYCDFRKLLLFFKIQNGKTFQSGIVMANFPDFCFNGQVDDGA